MSLIPCFHTGRGLLAFFFWEAYCTLLSLPSPASVYVSLPEATQGPHACPGPSSSQVHPSHEDCHEPPASLDSCTGICEGPENRRSWIRRGLDKPLRTEIQHAQRRGTLPSHASAHPYTSLQLSPQRLDSRTASVQVQEPVQEDGFHQWPTAVVQQRTARRHPHDMLDTIVPLARKVDPLPDKGSPWACLVLLRTVHATSRIL